MTFDIFGQSRSVEELETKLEDAEGTEKIEILIDLMSRKNFLNPHLTLSYGNDAKNLLTTKTDINLISKVWLRSGISYFLLGEFDSLMAHADYLTAMGKEYKNLGALADGKFLSGLYFFHRMEGADSLMSAVDSALKIYKSIGDPYGEVRSLMLLGGAHERKGDLLEAINHYNRSLLLAEEVGDSFSVSMAHSSIGNIYILQGSYARALESHLKSLAINKEIDWKWAIAKSSNEIGQIYIGTGDYRKAVEVLKEANRLSKELGLKAELIMSYSNMGLSYKNLGLYEVAFNHLQEALNLSIKTNHNFLAGTIAQSFSETYLELDSLNKAIKYSEQAIAFNKKNTKSRNYISSLNWAGKIQLVSQNPEVAIKYASEALDLAGEIGMLNEVVNSLDVLCQAYQAMGQIKRAFEYQRLYINAKDSLFNINKAKEIVAIEWGYEVDKMTNEISSLNAQAEVLEHERKYAYIISFSLVFMAIFSIAMVAYFRWKRAQVDNLKIQQLEEINRAKARFFANISHEQRTPLTLISGLLDRLLEDENLAYKYKKPIQLATDQTKYLEEMTNDIMSLTRLNAGTTDIQRVNVNIVDEIHRIFGAFESPAKLKKISYNLSCLLLSDLVVSLDLDKLEKILNNLISNALKFTDEGGVLHLNVDKTIDNRYIRFIIKDTGRGIHPEDLPRVFDRYYQTSRAEVPAEGGAGIGLTLVSELTSLLDGTIKVESKPDEGSTFTLLLPLIEGDQNAIEMSRGSNFVDSLEVSLPNEDRSKTAATHGDTVMIVEDNLHMQQFIGELLESRYHILKASDGMEALDILESGEHQVDLIVSDVMMPKLDGFGLLEKLKQEDSWAHIPVIMLTARVEQKDRMKALLIGVDDYLTKPFSAEELMVRCTNLLNNYANREKPKKSTMKREGETVRDTDHHWLKKAELIMVREAGNIEYGLEELSHELRTSQRTIRRKILSTTGMAPRKYFREVRLSLARDLLESVEYNSISEVCYRTGFESPAYFSREFKKRFGKNPSEYLKESTG